MNCNNCRTEMEQVHKQSLDLTNAGIGNFNPVSFSSSYFMAIVMTDGNSRNYDFWECPKCGECKTVRVNWEIRGA